MPIYKNNPRIIIAKTYREITELYNESMIFRKNFNNNIDKLKENINNIKKFDESYVSSEITMKLQDLEDLIPVTMKNFEIIDNIFNEINEMKKNKSIKKEKNKIIALKNKKKQILDCSLSQIKSVINKYNELEEIISKILKEYGSRISDSHILEDLYLNCYNNYSNSNITSDNKPKDYSCSEEDDDDFYFF